MSYQILTLQQMSKSERETESSKEMEMFDSNIAEKLDAKDTDLNELYNNTQDWNRLSMDEHQLFITARGKLKWN